MMKLGKLTVSAGFIFLLAALYYFDQQGVLPWFLLACAVHEAAHWLALRLAGGQIQALRLTAVGAEMKIQDRALLSYPAELLAVLAGPAANLLLAIGAAQAGRLLELVPLYTLSGVSFVLSLFNLLPAVPLDGGRAVFLLLSWMGLPWLAERVERTLSLVTAAAVTAAGGALLYCGGGFTLLIVGFWLLAGTLGRYGKKSCQPRCLGIE